MPEKTNEKPTIAGLISKAAKRLQEEFQHIREIVTHSGEKGGETEDKVRQFLNGHIPKRFHATKGFVIDSDNQMSDHQDVIIYDQQSSAVFKYDGANQIVPADAVASIIEVKAVLNKSQLEEAFAKIAEVKRLRKSPIGKMDQATTATISTTGTLGIILGFGSDITLSKLAAHCVALNENYETAHRPDMIVVLDVGVIDYTAQFVGSREMGDMAFASDDFVPPPCFVHLVAREDGAFSLNRLFTRLISYLALYPRRPSIPPLSVLLEGTSTLVQTLGLYQFNTEKRLVRFTPPPATAQEQNPIIRVHDKNSKQELATLTYIPWQDGGVIRKTGQIPLIGLLVWFTKGEPPRAMRVENTEVSMVLKITRPEFEKWPATIERQSNMTAKLEAPTRLFETRPIGSEGLSEPFVARVFFGLVNLASSILSPQEKTALDFGDFGTTLLTAMELRQALLAIQNLLSDHREALVKGTIVRKLQADPLVSERIDSPLRSHTVKFLEMADKIIETLPGVLKYFNISIDNLTSSERRFTKDCERNEGRYPELVRYLRKLRPLLLDIAEQFKNVRVHGWNLANVKYVFTDGVVTLIEPQIGGEMVGRYIERVFSILALAIEELTAFGFQKALKGSMVLAEVSRALRDSLQGQRFKLTIDGMEPAWLLTFTGRSFYES
jgi:hypothetical protein